jgi:glycosyltransferase involved in cell wall biosynthesis
LRLAVVSPFLDRRHGTERCIVEQIERLAREHGCEIHLYCQRVEQVEDVRLSSSPSASPGKSQIVWHKIPDIPGPHLLRYLWWFAANHFCRWRDYRSGRVRPDLIYSPGINCLDADAVAVHIVFHEFYRRVRSELRLHCLPLRNWPRTIHRKLYYLLICFLETRVYRNPQTCLAAVSRLAANELAEHFQRSDVIVIPNAVDTDLFRSAARVQRRTSARKQFGFEAADFVLLLIGNDWKKKGLDCLLEALAASPGLPLRLLVVGRDDRSLYLPCIEQSGIGGRVIFADPSPDVLQFYAAADLYVGPSLEDSFGLPVLEAMACGLPAITSAFAGVSEYVHDGIDGFILSDPRDSTVLARLVRQLYEQTDLCRRVGEAAACTAQAYTWDRNARETWAFLMSALEKKDQRTAGHKRTAEGADNSAGEK